MSPGLVSDAAERAIRVESVLWLACDGCGQAVSLLKTVPYLPFEFQLVCHHCEAIMLVELDRVPGVRYEAALLHPAENAQD
jgi:hypothetical protein